MFGLSYAINDLPIYMQDPSAAFGPINQHNDDDDFWYSLGFSKQATRNELFLNRLP